MTPADVLRSLATDLAVACLFYTRLRLPHRPATEGADMARAGWAAPIAGAIVGLVGAAVYWLAYAAGLPPLVGAVLAVAATMGVTGCLHEDGLADTADGFGGGATRERKLEIMRDSRIGNYGACVLVLSIMLRVSALASLGEPVLVAAALIAAHAAARGALPPFMRLVPPARPDGLSATAGTPPPMSAVAAGVLGVAALLLGLGPTRGAAALLLVLVVGAAAAWLCSRQIGGQTGDVLGALEQMSEIAILVTAAARI